jgi:hypothetical protein
MANRAGSTTVEINSSHLSMISHPRAVVDLDRGRGRRLGDLPSTRSPAPRFVDRSGAQARRLHDQPEVEGVCIRRHGPLVLPVCSFVRAFIQRHPEYSDLVAFT